VEAVLYLCAWARLGLLLALTTDLSPFETHRLVDKMELNLNVNSSAQNK
jgi:hypothetical protein